jgi:hypothetical protein
MAFGKLVTGLWLIRLSLPGSKPLNKAKKVLLGFATVSAVKPCKTRSQPDSDSSSASAQGEIQSDGPKRGESQLPESDSRRQDSQPQAAIAGADSPQEGLCPPVARISSPQLLPPSPARCIRRRFWVWLWWREARLATLSHRWPRRTGSSPLIRPHLPQPVAKR